MAKVHPILFDPQQEQMIDNPEMTKTSKIIHLFQKGKLGRTIKTNKQTKNHIACV